MHLKEYKIAAQYLWLFQKLNAASIAASSENNGGNSQEPRKNQMENELHLFSYMAKSSNTNMNDFNSKLKHEQKMHSRLMLTIYLANA